MRQHPYAPLCTYPVLSLLLLFAVIIGIMQGAVALSPVTTLKILLRSVGISFGPVTWTGADETILLELRLPRVLGGALVGAGLATAGVLFQGLLRNPLADPYIIGTSAGAGFAATMAILVLPPASILGFGSVALSAFAGGLLAVLLVYRLARVDGHSSPVTLLLAGVIVNAVLAPPASAGRSRGRPRAARNSRSRAPPAPTAAPTPAWPRCAARSPRRRPHRRPAGPRRRAPSWPAPRVAGASGATRRSRHGCASHRP